MARTEAPVEAEAELRGPTVAAADQMTRPVPLAALAAGSYVREGPAGPPLPAPSGHEPHGVPERRTLHPTLPDLLGPVGPSTAGVALRWRGG